MPVMSIGDAAQQFASMRAGTAIKSDLARLSASLSTGKVTDITRHLNGETSRFTGFNHNLQQLAGFQQAARETSQLLEGVQTVLGRVESERAALTDRLLLISDVSTAGQVNEAATAARSTFDAIVSTLNTRLADRTLMGGRDVSGAAVVNASTMVNEVMALIGADRTVTGITTVVEGWFNDLVGGFSATGYQGDADGFLRRQISQDRQVDIAIRANDPAIRDILKATMLAGITDILSGLGSDVKAALVQKAGPVLFGAASPLAAAQARVGTAQATVVTTQTEMTAQQTGLTMAVNDLIAADPFDTATRLQSVQLQLEKHFTVVGRLAQLSLVRFI